MSRIIRSISGKIDVLMEAIANGQSLSNEELVSLENIKLKVDLLRDMSIYRDHLSGMDNKDIGTRYNLSISSINRIVKKIETTLIEGGEP